MALQCVIHIIIYVFIYLYVKYDDVSHFLEVMHKPEDIYMYL